MVEVQDIIKKYGKEYKAKNKMLPHVAKAMGAIEKCRTAVNVKIRMYKKSNIKMYKNIHFKI